MGKILLDPRITGAKINKNIYGHFSEHLGRCVYQGLYVGEDSTIPNVKGMRTDVVEALKKIGIPVLRWPGGCFADEYHWEDGVGPKAERKRMVNTNWGGVVEDNSFGTHEFLELCAQLGCEPYINANVGSGTVREMAEWVEYLNSAGDSTVVQKRWRNGRKDPWGVKYWGVGNESWGCGGNMRPEYYADEFRRYQTYCRDYGDNTLIRIACGPSEDDYRWMEVLMERAGRFMDAITLHYYTVPGPDWQHKGSATDFDRDAYYTTLHKTLRMEELVENHSRIIRRFAKGRPIGLCVDEWGTWYDVEPGTNPGFLYQQNTMRDALVAAVNLNIFNNHCDTVVMANIAQLVNVLQAMLLTEGDKVVLTPTSHVFAMYSGHQGARQLESYAETRMLRRDEEQVPELHVSASEQSDGTVLVTAAKLNDTEPVPVNCLLGGIHAAGVTARVLAGAPFDHNTFDRPEAVRPAPLAVTPTETGFTAVLPPCSVAAFTVCQK